MDDHDPGTGDSEFDPAAPLKGIIVCCTGISPEERQQIITRTAELGGIHRFDLTPDVTHLLISDCETAKYRHVARERPDVKPMDPGWIEAINTLWTNDEHIDFASLEKKWQLLPLEAAGAPAATAWEPRPTRRRLLVCLTGFDDIKERGALQDRISSNGGIYTGDLTKRCTHLIVSKPEGKKYRAAKNWKIKTVSVEWLFQSTDRGMILDERCYDPTLPPEERGNGARVTPEMSFGKRPRAVDSLAETEGRQRKLRKTASMKLSSQRNSFLGDLLAQKPTAQQTTQPADASKDDWQDVSAPAARDAPDAPNALTAPELSSVVLEVPPTASSGIFSTSYFYVHGFEQRKSDILSDTIRAMGGRVCHDVEEVGQARAPSHPWHRFIVVPQECRPEMLDFLDDAISPTQTVTEFFIESCLHNKQLFDPDDHVLGRPFPVFPIDGFETLTICSAGFTGIDLHHLAMAVSQLGAKFDETFRRTTSLLLCKSLGSLREMKKRLALDNGIPVVSGDWLWECISAGTYAPVEKFMFPELNQVIPEKKGMQRTRSEPIPAVSKAKPKAPAPRSTAAVDMTAFESDEGTVKASTRSKSGSNPSTRYQTARTNFYDSRDDFATNRPLKEVSVNSVSRSESPMSNPSRDSSDERPDAERKRVEEERRAVEEERTRVQEEKERVEKERVEEERRRAEEEKRRREEEENRRAEEAEEEERRKAEERRRKEQEILALQTKVTSLIDHPSGSTASEPDSVQDNPLPSKRERRKRGIFGRAVSNVSTTSNNSESREHVPVRPEGDSQLGLHADEGNSSIMPPMTQVEYVDPEALAAQAELLETFNGKVGGVGGVGTGGRAQGVRTSGRRKTRL